MKYYQSTLDHKRHKELEEMKKITQKDLDAKIEMLEANRAEYNDMRTPKPRRDELREALRDISEEIKHDQMWLDTNCETAKMDHVKGKRLIGTGDGFEIVLND